VVGVCLVMPAPAYETPRQAAEKLRQAFDSLKEKHTDPWNWHEYLSPDPVEQEDDEVDPEILSLRPKKRSNIDRMKAHILMSIQELNRCSAAADMCYFHLCTNPKDQKECATVLGTSGDIDEELLGEAGDASPAKIMAALQKKLDKAREQIADLEVEITALKEELSETRYLAEQRWCLWQTASFTLEESLTRLHNTTVKLNQTLFEQGELKDAYEDLYYRWVRASRILLYKGREWMRDKIFKAHPKENLFYAFNGFCFTLQAEKQERKRREEEAKRDAVEFALRNEVRFMVGENSRVYEQAENLTMECGRLKLDRRELSCRLLRKHRVPEELEFLLWVWELWCPLRPQLALEKELEQEQAMRAAVIQQLSHTSSQLPTAAKIIDKYKRMYAMARVEKDIARREIMSESGKTAASLIEHLQGHRVQELYVLGRLHRLDVEAKEERIAILERELAEDMHIQSLKGMVVDLESRLRKAIDRRRQKPFVVPPGTGQKCLACGREDLFKNWKVMPRVPDAGLQTSLSDGELPIAGVSAHLAPLTDLPGKSKLAGLSDFAADESSPSKMQVVPLPSEKKPTYLAVWR